MNSSGAIPLACCSDWAVVHPRTTGYGVGEIEENHAFASGAVLFHGCFVTTSAGSPTGSPLSTFSCSSTFHDPPHRLPIWPSPSAGTLRPSRPTPTSPLAPLLQCPCQSFHITRRVCSDASKSGHSFRWSVIDSLLVTTNVCLGRPPPTRFAGGHIRPTSAAWRFFREASAASWAGREIDHGSATPACTPAATRGSLTTKRSIQNWKMKTAAELDTKWRTPGRWEDWMFPILINSIRPASGNHTFRN